MDSGEVLSGPGLVIAAHERLPVIDGKRQMQGATRSRRKLQACKRVAAAGHDRHHGPVTATEHERCGQVVSGASESVAAWNGPFRETTERSRRLPEPLADTKEPMIGTERWHAGAVRVYAGTACRGVRGDTETICRHTGFIAAGDRNGREFG